MFTTITVSVSAIILIIAVLYFYNYLPNSRKNAKYIVTSDPKAQSLYEQRKHKNDKQQISFKERVEISWKFLYDIAAVIRKKFSAEDKAAINKIGHTLYDAGVRYEHVVGLGTQPTVTQSQTVEVEKEQSQQGRSV